MADVRQGQLPGLVLAGVLVAAAAAVRAVLFPLVGTAPFLPFFPAVIACAILAGRTAGIAATVLSVIVLVLLGGIYEHAPSSLAATATLALFIGIGLMTVWLAETARGVHAADRAATDARLRLAAIVEGSDDAIVSKDLDGNIRTWNAAAERLYGYPAAGMIGQSITRLVPADLVAEQAAVAERLRRGERVEAFETLRVTRSGTPVRVAVTLSPLRDAGGKVIGAVDVARDVSPRLRIEADLRHARDTAQQTVAQLRATIDHMSEGVVVSDPLGNLLEWSRPALRTHGFESFADVRRHLSNFAETFELYENGRRLPLDEWPLSRVLRGEQFSDLEVAVRRLDKPLDLVINYGGGPVLDAQGRVALGVLTLHDVTEERRLQRAQLESAERLSLALDAAGLGDWEWDARTDAMTLSPAAAALFGVSPGAPVTREKMRELLHEADRDRARRAAQRAVEVHGDYDAEYRITRDGRTVWVSARGRSQFDAEGNVVRMLGVVQDITPRKLAEQDLRESREWLELAVAIAQTGTFRLTLADRRLTLNDAGRAIYGFGVGDAVTPDAIRALMPAELLADFGRLLTASYDPDGPRRFEFETPIRRASDGITRWVRVRGRTLFEDAADGPRAVQSVGTFIDVTEEKERGQRREQMLAAEQSARQQAEHASRMKDEFLATLSHELRTPLNAILGWAEILAAEGPGPDFQQAVDVIRRNARAQAKIIEDLLDMSRIISGKVRLDLRPIELPQLATTAVDTVRPTADAKGVRLVLDLEEGLTPIVGDPARVQQVLWNLLVNAIKFTPKGGEVRLRLRRHDDAAATFVELCVIDTGDGISADFLPHVFDRFRQADASITRRHGGLGLGLAIVKQLSELHGGTVRVHSDGPGRGATFCVRLPAVGHAPADASAPTPAGRGGHAVPASLAGVRVLVVDDEPDARNLVCRLLEDRGAAVRLAGSAAEAWETLRDDNALSLVVSDIGMPGEDGYSLMARVRAAGMATPAVALSAYARDEDRQRALDSGFQSHLAKPVDAGALVATVARMTGRDETA